MLKSNSLEIIGLV